MLEYEQTPTEDTRALKFLIRYIKPHLPIMSLGLVIKIIGTLMDLVIPYILEHIIDVVVPSGIPKHILFWGALMVVCALIGLVGNIVANRMASAVARDTTRDIRHDLFQRISYLSPKQIDEITIPTLETRLTSDTYNIHHMVGMLQRLGVRAPILLIGGMIVTFRMEPVLSLVLLSVLPFITLAVFLISKRGIPLFRKLQQKTDDMVGIIRESAQGIRVIKALSKTRDESEKFDRHNRAVSAVELHSGSVMAVTNPLMSAFLNVGMAAVILVGAYRVNGGQTEAGMIIAFMSYFTLILNAMLAITRMFTLFSKGATSAARIAEVIEVPYDLTVRDRKEKENNEAYVEFRDVSFSYNGRKETVSHVSFTLQRGQTLGLIGATGSGKSTLIQLLLRFYDVDSGKILLDGYDIRSLTPEELRGSIGIVLQNDFIYAGTILDNIDFGRDLNEETVRRAAEPAQAAEFIDALEDAYQHELNTKGTNLSGGQKQRVLISRALAGKPDILILDDASSALDYRTDAKLRAALREQFEHTTKIIVAQRISSIAHADRILVLDNGHIVGDGTHESLLTSCDIYREISQSQIGGDVQ